MYRDTRGQVVQIAAILLLAVAVLAFAGYQATVVPQQTASAEQDHNERTSTDLQQVQRAIERTAETGETSTATVRMAPQYRSRLLAVNPPPRPARFRTEPLETGQPGISIDNAEALDADSELHDRWDGSELTFVNNRTVYEPEYNRFRSPPTRIYEASVLYNRFENGEATVQSDQKIVDGDRIRLTSVSGEVKEYSTRAVTVEPRPLSAPRRSVTVTGSGSSDIELTLVSGLSENDWQDLLSEEQASGNVNSISHTEGTDFNETTIVLDGSEEYELELGAVGLGRSPVEPEATYLVDSRGDGTKVPTGTTIGLLAQVRDEYDNPAAGQDVRAEAYVETISGSDVVLSSTSDVTVTNSPTTSGDAGGATMLVDIASDADKGTYYVVAGLSTGGLGLGGTQLSTLDGDPDRVVFQIEVTDLQGFQTVFVSDVITDVDQSDKLEQEFRFTPASSIGSGSTVTIDLDDAQGINTGGTTAELTYENAQVDVRNSGQGTASISVNRNTGTGEIEFQASRTISSGEQVVIDLTRYETDSSSNINTPSEKDITFTRGDTGDSNVTSFNINEACIVNSDGSRRFTNIQDAVDDTSCQTIYIEEHNAGRYNGNVNIDRSDLTITNYGTDTPTIEPGGSNAFNLQAGSDGTTIEGLEIDNPAVAVSVQYSGAEGITVRDNTITDATKGVDFSSTTDGSINVSGNSISTSSGVGEPAIDFQDRASGGIEIAGNEFPSLGGPGILFQGRASDVEIRDNTITDANGDGIRIATAENVDILDGTISTDGNGGDGVQIGAMNQPVTVDGTTIDSVDGHGMYLVDSIEDLTVNDTEISNTGGHGIYLESGIGPAVDVSNSRVENTGQNGIYLEGDSDGVSVTNTDVIDAGTDGILIEGQSEDITIEGGTVESSSRHGINLLSSTTRFTVESVTIDDTGQHGIRGEGMTPQGTDRFANTTIRNTDDDPWFFSGDITDVTVDNVTIEDLRDTDGLVVQGTSDDLTVTDSTITSIDNGYAGLNLGVVTNLNISDVTVEGQRGGGPNSDDKVGVDIVEGDGRIVDSSITILDIGVQFDGSTASPSLCDFNNITADNTFADINDQEVSPAGCG